jgi:hypothetical protein
MIASLSVKKKIQEFTAPVSAPNASLCIQSLCRKTDTITARTDVLYTYLISQVAIIIHESA